MNKSLNNVNIDIENSYSEYSDIYPNLKRSGLENVNVIENLKINGFETETSDLIKQILIQYTQLTVTLLIIQ